MQGIVANGLESFELHVAALQLPLVVLFEKQGADKPDDRAVIRKAPFCGASTIVQRI